MIDLPRPLAFVLGAGGSLGASQVGMLQALRDEGLTPDLIVGASVGSLNGAFLAADPVGGASRLSYVWPALRSAAVFPGSRLEQALSIRRQHTFLHPASGLAAVIAEHLAVENIEDLQVPFTAVATDVQTAAPVLLSSGDLANALLASAAIPGVFPAVEREGRWLYDGGMVASVPMRQAQALGAKSLVVLDCGLGVRNRSVPSTFAQVMTWSLDVLMRQQARADVELVSDAVPVVYMPVQSAISVNPLDFRHTLALMHSGYELAKALLGGLEVEGAGLYTVARDALPPGAEGAHILPPTQQT